MSNFALEELQVVQCTQDTTNHYLIQTHKLQSTKKLTESKDTQISNELNVSHRSKPSKLMMSSWSQKCRSTASGSSIFSGGELNIETNNDNNLMNKSNSNNFKKLSEKDYFQCKSCLNNLQKNCQICKGKKQLNGGDNMVKFFQYVWEFKMGVKQSYVPEKKVIKKSNPNEHCNVYFSNIIDNLGSQIQGDERLSLSVNTNRIISRMEHQEKVRNLKDIQHGYNCDQCDMDPIVGIRFHCDECGDFDLCEVCHTRKGHFHPMKKMELRNNQKTMEAVGNILKGQNGNCLKSVIRNSFSSFGSGNNSKVYKSSIR